MTDQEKKIAEIRMKAEFLDGCESKIEVNLADLSKDIRFLLSELDREREENQRLREELDQQRAQTEFFKGESNLRYEWYWEQNKQLQSAQQDREKLIEGLRWYADRDNYRGYYAAGGYWKSPANDEMGNRARSILKEIGVNVE